MRREKREGVDGESLETVRTQLATEERTEASFASGMREFLGRVREEGLEVFGWVEWHEKAMIAPLGDFGRALEEEIGRTEQGRLFWKEGEIRWKRWEGEFRVVFLGEDAEPLGLADKTEVLRQEGLDSGTTFWVELGGGHLFGPSMSLGLPESRRWCLRIAEYHRSDRSMCFSRYCGLEVRSLHDTEARLA